MAIYHFSAKVISRSTGRSAVAAAAYRSGSRLHDRRIERDHDFSHKSGVVHSEVLLPEHAPEHYSDRERLWNEVEAFEKRKDAQLCREVEFAIPREMNQQQGIALARDFVQREFVDQGMIADLNVHWDVGADGLMKPHAHVMLTMRSVDESGFGQKVRDWNRTERLERWREHWASHVNERLAELDIDARIDHHSFEAQGIDLEPQNKIGPAADRMDGRGLESERTLEHHEIARRNGERIIADPGVALDAMTHQQATFTSRDLAMFVHRHSDGLDQFNEVMGAVRASPDLIELGKDGRGQERFTSRQMVEAEQRLQRATQMMTERERHRVEDRERDAALARAEQRGLTLSGEQRTALEHVTGERDLGVVVGLAGAGKSAMLGVAREAWESAGYEVRGVALSGIAAENLEAGSGIGSRTIASMEHGWTNGRDLLTSRDVLVIDEAGMVGTRQMERVLSHATEVGAKVVLVGDPQQLQSIEAGAAFRSVHERHGGVEIAEVRRQRQDWQRDATRDLATGRTGQAIERYAGRGMVHATETREQARADLIERWDRERQAAPDQSRIILTHTNDEVRALNEAARGKMREAGDLGQDAVIKAERGERHFASGDRVMFLKNERGLEVKNGTLGTVVEVNECSMSVRTDDGRSVAFDLKDYAHVDHGYAATVHKSQGMTVDRTHVLATPGMDAHSSYVGMSRHRNGMDLHYGRDDFASQDKLARTLGRERAKDMASDYDRAEPARSFAERRGIAAREAVTPERRTPDRAPEMSREVAGKGESPFAGLNLSGNRMRLAPGTFDGLKLSPSREQMERIGSSPQSGAKPPTIDAKRAAQMARERARSLAVERHARAVNAIWTMEDKKLPVLPHQRVELDQAREELGTLGKEASRDIEKAYRRDPSLAQDAAEGRPQRAIRAMQLEAEIRSNPERRADRFVEDWTKLKTTSQQQYKKGDMADYRATRATMGAMAKSLERDPQMESILEGRKRELGIGMESGRNLSRDLANSLGLGRGRDVGLGL